MNQNEEVVTLKGPLPIGTELADVREQIATLEQQLISAQEVNKRQEKQIAAQTIEIAELRMQLMKINAAAIGSNG